MHGAENRPKILVVGPVDEPFWVGLAALNALADVVISNDEETVAREIAKAEVVYMWDSWSLLERVWQHAQSLRWVHCAWAGVDRMLFPELLASDVTITRTAGIYGSALAEYALAGMLHFAKRVPELQAAQRERAWRKIIVAELRGKTAAIVGLGDVGSAVAEKARALGMRVIGVRRNGGSPPDGVDRLFSFSELDEALKLADYLIVCTPLTEETYHIIGARELAMLKPDAVLVNIARGGVVDEEALISALHTGGLAGAVVDVFEQEPLPPESPFFDAPNVLVSSHTVDTVLGWEERAVQVFVGKFRLYSGNQPLPDVVDKERGY